MYAFQGIWHVLRSQHNAWIHLVATVAVVFVGIYFRLSVSEWCWIVVATTSVWAVETLNTALELLADATTKEFHPLIGQAKNVAAGAVLITSIGAAIIGILIFLPHLQRCFVEG